ncbi:uncharacterized protein LOC141680518 [Apium graveolens]|uniref:uncharacterized protein LOC141680518 n=1 Tax=Apium graveolens TaxID=4045 RepID=UPI003D7B80E4
MPFGLINIGATYQRLVNMMFKNQIGRTMEVYVDDKLVKSKKTNDHIRHLMEMFNILRKFRMKLNPQKCVFGVESGKFLRSIVNHRGIEANPAKIKALLDIKLPTNVRQVQSLAGRISALNQFISKSSDRCKEFFKASKLAGKDFVWTPECEEAFKRIKEQLSGKRGRWAVVTSVLREQAVARRRNSLHKNGEVLHKPESSGRMLKWAVELGQFDLEYVPQTAIKGQALADFLLEFDSKVDDKALVTLHPPHIEESVEEFPHPWWILHYGALINGLRIALEMGVRNLIARNDSKLVVNQVNGGFQARGPRTELYFRCTQRLIGMFKEVRLECVPREKNSNADALAKMGRNKRLCC